MSDLKHAQAMRKTGFWGKQGAGSLVLAQETGRILVAHRSAYVSEPNTFGTWGGAIDDGENPKTAALRELREESRYAGAISAVYPLFVFKHPSGFTYHNFLIVVPKEFSPQLDWETQGYKWCEWPLLLSQKHPGLVALLNHQPSVALVQREVEQR